MRTSPNTLFLALPILLGTLLGCSDLELAVVPATGSSCDAQDCFTPDGRGGEVPSNTDTNPDSSESKAGTDDINPLCGDIEQQDKCNPDEVVPSRCVFPQQPGDQDGGVEDASPENDGAAVDGGQDGADSDESDADGPDSDSDVVEGSMGGKPINPGYSVPFDNNSEAQLSCQVGRKDEGRVTFCSQAGGGADNAPCFTSADCAPGTTCVGNANMGVCRAYCCYSPESCAQGKYCGVAQSRDQLLNNPDQQFLLPVCIPGNDCELLPGPDGINRCAEGLICAVVRADGTTACVLSGIAGEGEQCRDSSAGQSACGEGFVCLKTTNTCVALCRVTDPNGCGDGVCQGGSKGLPEPYGVCVGGAAR
ncbi:MAG: hypothetical protein FWD57_09295 [Polyangiaceae bacterium]|nr:hypothetical protein [Polyangiaceae bacterium]